METRIAVVGIVVEAEESVEKLNEIRHEYRQYIIGRMGTVSYTHLNRRAAASRWRPRSGIGR